MAQFRGTVAGQRGEASRLGSKNSGLVVTANGWNAGVTVRASVDGDGNDVFKVYATGGSGYSGRNQHIATVRDGELEFMTTAESVR
jgi:hypothetical protein